MADRPTLRDLLPRELDSVAEQVRARLCEDEQVGGMKLAWDFIGKQVNGALAALLDCDLLEILAGAWAEAEPILAFADPAKHPPGERALVELGGHDIAREINPVIAVTVGSCPCVELKFAFTLTAHVGGVRLAILDGHIVGGDLGELWASAQLSFAGKPLHPPRDTAKFALPGAFEFSPPGVKIPRLSGAAVEGAADGG